MPAAVIIYVFVSAAMWAAATPMSGVPDEPSHIVYAVATVSGSDGAFVPNSADSGGLASYAVPEWVASLPNMPFRPCYAFVEGTTADCQQPLSDAGAPSSALTSVSMYQPVYYWIVGFPARMMTGDGAVYAMRLVSAVLASLLIGVGLVSAVPGRRWWLSIGVLLTFTPMVAFLAGGVNPNGAEITGSIGLAVAILGISNDSDAAWRPWLHASAVAVLGSMLAWARPYSWLNLGVIVGSMVLLNRRSVVTWVRSQRWAASVTGIVLASATATAIAYDVFVQGPSRSMMQASLRELHPPESFGTILATVVANSGHFLADTIGLFGWVDHSPPLLLQALWLLLLGVFVTVAVAAAEVSDRLILLAIAIGSTLVVPALVMQYGFGSTWGYQARYVLPLVVLLGLASVFVLGRSGIAATQGTIRIVMGVLGIFAPVSMGIAVVGSMARYSIGNPHSWIEIVSLGFLRDAAWRPPTAALGAVAAGMIALALLVPILFRLGLGAASVRFER